MTDEERQAIISLRSYREFWVFKKVANELLDELDRCSAIDDSKDIAAQALGRRYAKEYITDLFYRLGVEERKNIDQTYE